jgi:hypothetical protein
MSRIAASMRSRSFSSTPTGNQSTARIREHHYIEARIGELKGERVRSVDAPADGTRCVAIREFLDIVVD